MNSQYRNFELTRRRERHSESSWSFLSSYSDGSIDKSLWIHKSCVNRDIAIVTKSVRWSYTSRIRCHAKRIRHDLKPNTSESRHFEIFLKLKIKAIALIRVFGSFPLFYSRRRCNYQNEDEEKTEKVATYFKSSCDKFSLTIS